MAHTLKFAPNQKLPDGYTVEWWPQDEAYHWVHNPSRVRGHPDTYSEGTWCRFAARRGAIYHANRSKG